MLHFVEDFPVDAVQALLPIVRSGSWAANRVVAGEAALTIEAYALGQVLRQGGLKSPSLFGAAGAESSSLDDEQVMEHLESFAKANEHLSKAKGGARAKAAAKAAAKEGRDVPQGPVGALPYPATMLLRWILGIIATKLVEQI